MQSLGQERVVTVLKRMIELAIADNEDSEMLADLLEDFLSEIQSNDGFGTEGQSDPRGDFRNGEWSMYHVEGIDG